MNSTQIRRLLEACVIPSARVWCSFKICADYQLPGTLPRGHMYITNINNEHWVVLYHSMEGRVEYFDPGAAKPQTLLLECLEKSCTHYELNDFNLQKNVNDINCGLYCVLYAHCKVARDYPVDYIVLYIRMLRRSKKWVNCVDTRVVCSK